MTLAAAGPLSLRFSLDVRPNREQRNMSEILPLPTVENPDGLPPALVERLGKLSPLNVLWMLARTGWLDQILAALGAVFDPKAFPARDREIMILRIASFLHVGYPIPQHRIFGRAAGMGEAEMAAVVAGDYGKLEPWAAELARISEEITAKATLGDASLQKLVDRYGRDGATKAIWLLS
jgi:hypothetical protein